MFPVWLARSGILGLALGFFVLLTLRHPPFAVLIAIIGVLGFHLGSSEGPSLCRRFS